MKLELESGDVYDDVGEADIVEAINGDGLRERVVAAFGKYLRKDASWTRDFKWEKDEPIESFE